MNYDPFDPAVHEDPHARYRWLRHEAPAYAVANRGYWVLSRYADVHAALRDHVSYSSAKGSSPEPGLALGVIGSDPPKHTRLRRVVQSVFTPKSLERAWAPRVREICRSLVDEAIAARDLDAFRALSLPLPIRVIAEVIGIPDGDLDQFKAWSDAMCDGVHQHLDEGVKARTMVAFSELSEYFAAKVRERRGRRGEDIVTMLCDAGDEERLSDKEIVHFLILLLIAGNETTTNLIGNGLLALTEFPLEQDKLRANMSLLDSAIEEILRYCPPTQATFRQTTRAIEIHGTVIPADRRVMLSLASANRDEAQFADADAFRIDRDPNEHVAFGTGIHFCIGAALARIELRTMFGMLIERTRAIRRAGPPRMVSTIVIRGPVHLPLTFDAA